MRSCPRPQHRTRCGRANKLAGAVPLSRPPRLPFEAITNCSPKGGRVLDHLPGRGERLRCVACGNLTRFDVVASRRTVAFWHYTVAGDLTVEEQRDLAVVAEEVRCRWCGSTSDIEVVPAIGAGT